MDNLMLFYPLSVLLFFIFFDVRNRKKRPAPPPQQPADRQTQLPEEWQSRGYEDEDEEAVPWYVEFPEDRAPKKQPAAEKTYQEPVPAAAAAAAEPLYKRFEPQQPQPAFKSLRSSRTLAEDVRYGFVMAQILDKPRSLKPYDDSF